MNVTEAEEFAAVAQNWRDAGQAGDEAAAQAFEDQLHARFTAAELRDVEAVDPATGEPSAAETVRLRAALEAMWNAASARLDGDGRM